MTKRAVVTGSEGFVGRFVSEYLERRLGYFVLRCDNKYDPRGDMRKVLPKITGPVDVVVHCAANVGGRRGIDHAKLWQAENFELDRYAIYWATQSARAKHFIYFSSSAVYPTILQKKRTNPLLLLEKHRDLDDPSQGQPDSIYGLTKLVGEHLVRESHRAGRTQFTVFRPFSGYGPHQGAEYPMTAILRRAIEHRRGQPFEVWGDPSSKRDWVWIEDICIAVGNALLREPADEPFTVNLATGRGVSFQYVAETAATLAGKGLITVVGDTDKPAGVHTRVGDPTKLDLTLWEGHTPVSLEEGMYHTMEAMK